MKPDDAAIATAATALQAKLAERGFRGSPHPVVWRDHDLNRTHAVLWSRRGAPGETITLPGETLDYVVLIKPRS